MSGPALHCGPVVITGEQWPVGCSGTISSTMPSRGSANSPGPWVGDGSGSLACPRRRWPGRRRRRDSNYSPAPILPGRHLDPVATPPLYSPTGSSRPRRPAARGGLPPLRRGSSQGHPEGRRSRPMPRRVLRRTNGKGMTSASTGPSAMNPDPAGAAGETRQEGGAAPPLSSRTTKPGPRPRMAEEPIPGGPSGATGRSRSGKGWLELIQIWTGVVTGVVALVLSLDNWSTLNREPDVTLTLPAYLRMAQGTSAWLYLQPTFSTPEKTEKAEFVTDMELRIRPTAVTSSTSARAARTCTSPDSRCTPARKRSSRHTAPRSTASCAAPVSTSVSCAAATSTPSSSKAWRRDPAGYRASHERSQPSA